MKRINIILMVLILVAVGCGGWGGYKYKSDDYGFKVVFPPKWEVWDQSYEDVVKLEGSLPDDVEEARITLSTRKVAPDISSNEIYPSFLDGDGDGAIFNEFRITTKGTISAKNGDGRMIMVSYLGPENRMSEIRTIFLGRRFILEIRMIATEDDFMNLESDFRKMISLLEI
ncbi:hypothetical protein ACFLQV_02235 [Calditrichota bacterium]